MVENLEVGCIESDAERVIGIYTEADAEGIYLNDAKTNSMGLSGPENIPAL